MNYLEMVGHLHQLCGVSGTAPATVSGQTGERARLVQWIRRAWDMIQAHSPAWLWMQSEFSFQTTPGQRNYTIAQAGIASRFKRWDIESFRCFLTGTGVPDEQFLVQWDYPILRDTYLLGSQSTNQSRPAVFAIEPQSRAIVLADIPDQIYTIRGRYFRGAQTLTIDADVPEMPEDYHWAIVYRAMMMYANYESAGDVAIEGVAGYRPLMMQLAADQLPAVNCGSEAWA